MIGIPLSRLPGGFYFDLNKGDHTSSVFLAGSGRSGTTWLSQIINHRRRYRYVFEPFNPREVGPFGHFRTKQYLRPDDRRGEFLRPARLALTGGLRHPWTDRFNGRIVARRRLIKDIRANLLLGWINANFPGMPIILLLRHPCAVVTSRLALGWRDNLSETMEQQELVEDFLLPMEVEIRAAQGGFERHLFLWCIDNYVPLKQLGPERVHLIFYENLLARPDVELRSLFTRLGEDFDERVHAGMRHPSPLSRKDSPGPSLTGWRAHVNSHQLERAVEILRLFGLNHLYGEGSMPEPSGAYALMDGV